ncbi:hypothetical protein ACFV1C_00390 [Streptomyces sp. NPDC059605]|uniref:hypothetical protein n=1 Tax=Streptomyces sp. NPDC059605 TaxID=3346882 RepID=UPI0036840A4C
MSQPIVPATVIPTIEVITVTPALAAEWLSRNTHNRPLRNRRVTDYARDMKAGQWHLNGETMKFAGDLKNGIVLDGQHRLEAVVEANVDVVMVVVSGLPMEAQETMDMGSRRTVGDVFGLRGETNSHTLAAVLKRVWLWDQGDRKLAKNLTPTTAECAQLLQEHPEIYRSVEIAARVYGAFRGIPRSLVGTAHHILSRIDTDEAVWFFARIGDGAELSARHPVLTLRNRVMRDRGDRKSIPEYLYLAYMIRAWNAVRDGRDLTQIQHTPDDPMPLPK